MTPLTMFEAALQVAQRRRDLLGLMRAALVENREADALRFARQLCGLPEVIDATRDGGVEVKTRRTGALNTNPPLTHVAYMEATRG